jgi:hypothetical protein
MSKSSVDLERLTAAVERVESGGNPNAVSPKGAEGPMQVMPKTGKKPGYGVAPARDKSPEENRRVGREYLSAMVNKYGDIDTALVAYNWGPGNTDKWLKKGADPEKLPTETQNYVPRVKGLLGETPVQPQAQPTDRAALENQKFIEARAAVRNTRRAASAVAPVAEGPLKGLSEAHAKGVEKIGPNYQAALALSMGAGARPAEQEPMSEEMPEESAQPSRAAVALAGLKDMPVASAFGAPRALADGGMADGFDYDSVQPAPLLTLPGTPQSSSRSELSQMPIPGGMLQKQETVTAKRGKKGSAKGDLAELEYKLSLQSAAVKDQMQGLGSSMSALGSPAFTHRGAMSKPSMGVAHLEKGGTASQMLEVLKGYGKKAQEFAVENMISPADIATLAMKAKKMVPAGMLTYSGGLNEGEDAEIARMRENDRPNPPPKHFAWGGTAAFGDYYNPTTKTYTDAPPMMANPDYTTATYYEQDPSGKYVASKDPYKAAGPVYSYTPAVAGTDPYGDDEGWNPGTPGTPESYNAVAKPAATWNQAKILDPKSGYVSTTGSAPVATADKTSNWRGAASSTPASVLVPTRQPGITPPAGVTPGTSPTPDPVPTSQPGINAPVVRDNPYAMPAAPAAPAKPNPWEPGGEVHIPEDDLQGVGSNPGGIAAPVVRDNPYTMPKDTPVQAMLPKRPPPTKMPPPFSQPTPTPVVDTGLVPPPPQPTPWVVNRADGSPEAGETGAAYGNPAMLAAGEKMRARKMLEQFDKKKEPVTRDPTEAEAYSGARGPRTLEEAAGLDPKVDRSTFLPYSKKEGLHVPSAAADLMKLATASDPRYSHLMQPEEATSLAMNVMGGGMGASSAAKVGGPGTLGMFLGKASKTYNPAAEALLLKLEKEGVPPQEIYRITQEKFGHPYGRSPMDQQIKYEISDQGAFFKPLANERTVQPDKRGRSSLNAGAPYSRLGEVYHHPELQAAHPDLMKKTFLGLENTPEPSGGAMFDIYNVDTVPTAMDKFVSMFSGSRPGIKRGQKIHVGGPDEASRKEVLTHELNHFSQHLNKDWEGGSSLDRARKMYPDLMHSGIENRLQPIDFMDFAKDLKNQKPDQAKNMSLPDMVKQYEEDHVKPLNAALAEYRKLRKQGYGADESSNELVRKADANVARDIYNRISGEAESRLAAHRQNLSSKQLGETYPYEPNYFKTATDENLKDILHGPVTRAAGSPPTGERSYEKTARNDYEQFRKNVMENPDSDIEFELRAAPRPSNALAEDMKGTNLQKVPPRTYFYNDADLNKSGWTATEGKNKGVIIVAAKESDDPKKIRSKVNTMGHELHHRRVGEVGEENMPLHPTWLSGGIPPEKQNSIYNPRWKLEEVMNAFVPARTPNAENHPTDISSMHWGRRPNRETQEQIANLAGYEAMQKTGTPISQTAVGKAMLEKDPALLDYFYSQTSAGRPGGGVWDMYSPEYKRAITPSMKEKAAEMFKKWLVSHGINTVNR